MTFPQFAFRNVIRNRRIYAAFFMASVFSVMVFFLYSMLFFHPAIENRSIREFSEIGMFVSEVVLFIFTVFFLFYSMRAFLQARSKEFGILLHLGMEKGQLSKLIYLETMLIGAMSVGVGTSLGFIFSKFFFMIVREIVMIPSLPLYFSWQPFALTIGVFFLLFGLISIVAPFFIKSGKVIDLIHGEKEEEGAYAFSKLRSFLGVALIALSYVLSLLISNAIAIGFFILIPPLAMFGTYYFFTDSVPLFFQKMQSFRSYYWKNYRLLSISSGIARLRNNARMFFIVTIVSTIAFMSVGILASLTSFAAQYRAMNPLGLIYISDEENEYEATHIQLLQEQLKEEKIDYRLIPFRILVQRSVYSNQEVAILNVAQVNELANELGYPAIQLAQSSALFLPASNSSFKLLNERRVETVLEESDISITIDGAYPYQLFPAYSIGSNVIVLNQIDFGRIQLKTKADESSSFTYYAFHIPDWQATKEIGLSIRSTVTDPFLLESSEWVDYVYDNPGLNYSIIRITFSLLLFIGLLLAVVFFLATGSFIYFQIYTMLDQERNKFDVLRKLGLTNKEMKKIINRQLIPQFFFPWGVALLHSSFAFLSLQVIWDALAEISIAKELTLVLIGFTCLQIIYFYLIRWRYLVHIKATD